LFCQGKEKNQKRFHHHYWFKIYRDMRCVDDFWVRSYSWNKYGDECYLKMQMYWFVVIDVLGGVVRIRPSPGQGQPTSGAGRWFPPFSRMILCFEIIYLWCYFIISLLNDETTMKCVIEFLMIVELTRKCRSSSGWMLKQWQKC